MAKKIPGALLVLHVGPVSPAGVSEFMPRSILINCREQGYRHLLIAISPTNARKLIRRLEAALKP